MNKFLFLISFFLSSSIVQAQNQADLLPYRYQDITQGFNEGWVENKGVNIHYVEKGEGELILFLHGFPDFWYSWRKVMDILSGNYKVVAIDLRGYNKSDKPRGVYNYRMQFLMSDVVAVIDHFSEDGAILVANDWGGAIAWYTTAYFPEKVKGLVACNIPHPVSLTQYLADNPDSGAYTEKFMAEDAAENFTAEELARMVVSDERELDIYTQAMKASDFDAMFNYYRASYRIPSVKEASNQFSPMPKIESPVLVIHGLEDPVFPVATLNDTWKWIENRVSIHTLPGVGHFVQKEDPETVSSLIRIWLSRL